MTPKELKQELVAKGFLVLRSDPRRIVLAMRERANLIMDSGVWVEFDPTAALMDPDARFAIGCTVRSHQSDNRGESESAGLERARSLAIAFTQLGYVETGVRSVDIKSPSAPDQTLDTWQEVLLVKTDVRGLELGTELTRALNLPKAAG